MHFYASTLKPTGLPKGASRAGERQEQEEAVVSVVSHLCLMLHDSKALDAGARCVCLPACVCEGEGGESISFVVLAATLYASSTCSSSLS